MNRISKFTLSGLIAALTLTVVLGFKCTPEQKKAAVDVSLSNLCDLLKSKSGALGDAGAAVCAYQSNQNESVYQSSIASLNAILARHNLSAVELQGIHWAEDIFRYFAPQTFAEVDPNSRDAKAAKKEIEDKFRRLEKLIRTE